MKGLCQNLSDDIPQFIQKLREKWREKDSRSQNIHKHYIIDLAIVKSQMCMMSQKCVLTG